MPDTTAARRDPAWPAPGALVEALDDERRSLADRIVAGAVLGLLGDPRVPTVPDLVEIPGGDFRLGTDDESLTRALRDWAHLGLQASWLAKETPSHPVRVDDYRIGRYPITNRQYQAFLAATGHESRPSTWYLGAYPWDRSNHPVAGVRAADADAYVTWLRSTTGRDFRLPTEAEWEYAARGGDDREFPWGDSFDPAFANVHETGLHTTSPVGAFPGGRSAHGAYDLAGNVEEYVADDFAPYPGGPAPDRHDDLLRTLGRYRITRGGSFARYGDLARTRRRHGPYPGPEYPPGFRVACAAERP